MTQPQLLTAWAGHWTGDGTGVTVILPPAGTVASGEVRGGAPATREFALLDPTRLVDRADAVVLSGGSAFGLAAAEGVMGLLRERGAGFPTPLGAVPIVIGMSIFDGSVAGTPPDAAGGRAAALAALGGEAFGSGRVGAGTGATTGKWRGRLDRGGLGWAELPAGAARVAALVVVNAWGDVLGPDGTPIFKDRPANEAEAGLGRNGPVAGLVGDGPAAGFGGNGPAGGPGASGPDVAGAVQNTTVGVVLTDARLGKTDCFLLAQSGHTGLARSLHPAHSRFDGDAVVALASGEVAAEVSIDLLRAVAVDAVIAAVRAAVTDG